MDELIKTLRADWPEILVEKHWMMDSDAIDKQRSEAADAIEVLRDALADLLHAVCGETGFAEAVRRDSGRMYPWPALELAEAKARAALDQSK